MANFLRTWLDTFVDGMPVTADQLKDIDKKLVKTINATDGSVHAPSTPIEIGGVGGVKFTGPCIVTSEAQLQGGAVVSGGDLTVAQDAHVQGQLECETLNCNSGASFGAIQTFGGGGADIDGNCIVGGTLSVAGTCSLGPTTVDSLTCFGPAQFGGPTTLNGATTVSSAATLNLNGTTNLRKPMDCIDDGRVVARLLVIATDADQNVGASNTDDVLLPAGIFSANRFLNITDAGAKKGDRLRVGSRDPANSLFLRRTGGGAGTMATLRLAGETVSAWADLVFDGTQWQVHRLGPPNSL